MKNHLISFSVGLKNNRDIVDRFLLQAKNCTFIDRYTVITDEENKIYDSFMDEFGPIVKANKRGYGYWLWKPYIIKHYINEMEDGEILIYADIGCEFSSAGEKIFKKYINYVSIYEILAFSTLNGKPESAWSKKELIDFFKLPDALIKQEQAAATFFMIKVSKFTREFISEWLNLSQVNNIFNINDILIKQQNKNFIEHRHDQSVFSLLLKKYKIPILKKNTNFPLEVYYKGSYVYFYPIHPLRSKTEKFYIKQENIQIDESKLKKYIKFILILMCAKIKRNFLYFIKQ
jgi:hypothetical protein